MLLPRWALVPRVWFFRVRRWGFSLVAGIRVG
ncbi:hypothetical protein JOE68_006138 [Saccharothrix algeriensis]|uniref:Uncharacterized protein n=1 Tax=Saccharothrix algeriensis TaxID=173560 RepID=A0ABS2SJ02_9PSEU|nr:hypothetical protein [Saccharothrix algeriensis]